MLRILATTFAVLLGLCFGSFLNVCVSRWPEGESIVHPRSHCRACGRTLAWWENIPLVSWVALRGKCRTCGAGISVRYVVVEAAVGVLWAVVVWEVIPEFPLLRVAETKAVAGAVAAMLLLWLLVALAVLDAENLWLPNFLTLPGTVIGLAFRSLFYAAGNDFFRPGNPMRLFGMQVVGVFVAAGVILISRWLYWLIRRREGVGMGDVKLMAMLGAWLGLPGALLALFIGIMLGAVAAIGVLLKRRTGPSEAWAASKLPFGTFICIGGIVSALWGQPILTAYMRWAGF